MLPIETAGRTGIRKGWLLTVAAGGFSPEAVGVTESNCACTDAGAGVVVMTTVSGVVCIAGWIGSDSGDEATGGFWDGL